MIINTINSVSTVSFSFVMSFAEHGSIGHYLWLGGNLDIMINSISLFSMLGCNQRYISFQLSWSQDLDAKQFIITQKNIILPASLMLDGGGNFIVFNQSLDELHLFVLYGHWILNIPLSSFKT